MTPAAAAQLTAQGAHLIRVGIARHVREQHADGGTCDQCPRVGPCPELAYWEPLFPELDSPRRPVDEQASTRQRAIEVRDQHLAGNTCPHCICPGRCEIQAFWWPVIVKIGAARHVASR